MDNLKIYNEIIGAAAENGKSRLLLHSCCGPCSSHVIETLAPLFNLTVFYYNPNIDTLSEYNKRAAEQERLIAAAPFCEEVEFIRAEHEAERYAKAVTGLEGEPEGGRRCGACFFLRLSRTAELAAEKGFDYFATTLSVSPHKNANEVNAAGFAAAKEYNAAYLPGDFKKKNGYFRSIELSREYGLYRQTYCGCVYSKAGK